MEFEKDLLERILQEQFERYPLMEMQDLYKLLHQAAMGSGHAVINEVSASQLFDRELAEMGEGPYEQPIDLISPDSEIVRVHLRSWRHADMDFDVVLQAFLRTAREWRGSKDALRNYGQATAQLVEQHGWNLKRIEVETFFAEMEMQGYPVVHHSDVFSKAYRPAYRVLRRKFLVNR